MDIHFSKKYYLRMININNWKKKKENKKKQTKQIHFLPCAKCAPLSCRVDWGSTASCPSVLCVCSLRSTSACFCPRPKARPSLSLPVNLTNSTSAIRTQAQDRQNTNWEKSSIPLPCSHMQGHSLTHYCVQS